MDTQASNASKLAASVIAVPPLARDGHGKIDEANNAKVVRFLEEGGVRTLLYGGNAVLYHIRLSEYAFLLETLQRIAGKTTAVVPSVGPSFGLAMDQAEVLKDFDFPTVMLLPQREIADELGIARGVRQFCNRYGKPIVLYLKHDRWLSPAIVKSLVDDGLVSWIKYAVVRDQPMEDAYLREVLQVVPSDIVVSGIGEQPAIIHMRDFGIVSYTSGCVCVAPKRSMEMLQAIHDKDWDRAESIRMRFFGLEDLRNTINPIRVLHRAVELAGIASTGPMQPMLGELTSDQDARIAAAAKELL
ncbi:MAG: dihydrodipicolinate synthase family protein, partial [Pirellulales bacterium]